MFIRLLIIVLETLREWNPFPYFVLTLNYSLRLIQVDFKQNL